MTNYYQSGIDISLFLFFLIGAKFIFFSRMKRHTERLTPARRALWFGLGLWWIVSALQQVAPRMGFASSPNWAAGPKLVGQPPWVAHIMAYGFHVWSGDPTGLNILSISLQFIIGVLLITEYETIVGLVAAALSVGVSLVIWIWGEGFGGLFTGHASFVFGAPGAGILAILPAIMLLVPTVQFQSKTIAHRVKVFWTTIFAIGVALQVQPALWTRAGWLANFPRHVSTGATGWLSPIASTITSDVAFFNGLTLLLLVVGLALWAKVGPSRGTIGYSLGLWLAFLIIGQGVGLRAQYGLDFNSAALAIIGTVMTALAVRSDSNPPHHNPTVPHEDESFQRYG